jgi:hypothetical protein
MSTVRAYAPENSTRGIVTPSSDMVRIVSEIASRFEDPTSERMTTSGARVVPKDDALLYVSTLREVAKVLQAHIGDRSQRVPEQD